MFSEKENIVQSGVHKFAQPASCLWSDLGFCNSRHMSFFSTVFGKDAQISDNSCACGAQPAS